MTYQVRTSRLLEHSSNAESKKMVHHFIQATQLNVDDVVESSTRINYLSIRFTNDLTLSCYLIYRTEAHTNPKHKQETVKRIATGMSCINNEWHAIYTRRIQAHSFCISFERIISSSIWNTQHWFIWLLRMINLCNYVQSVRKRRKKLSAILF